MTARPALRRFQKQVNGGWYRFTESALRGMEAHRILTSEVIEMILSASASDCGTAENGRFRIDAITDGREIRTILEMEASVIAVCVVVSAHLILQKDV